MTFRLVKSKYTIFEDDSPVFVEIELVGGGPLKRDIEITLSATGGSATGMPAVLMDWLWP